MARAKAIKKKKSASTHADERRYLREAEEATRYTERWHETRDQATDILSTIANTKPVYPKHPGKQTEIVRVPLIRAPTARKSAYRSGWSPSELQDQLPSGKGLPSTGTRRVLIRAYAWLVDDEEGEVFDPQWITLIHKLSPDASNLRQAFRNAHDWLDQYVTDQQFSMASKQLIFTQIELVYWTGTGEDL